MASNWSIPILILGALGALGMIVLALTAGQMVALAGCAAVLLLALGTYLAAPARAVSRNTPPIEKTDTRSTLPDAAKTLLNSLDDPIVVLDVGGKVLFSNSASTILVGGDSDRKHISAVLRYPVVLEGAERVLAGGEAESIFLTVKVPLERYYRVRIAPLVSAGASLLILQFNDLTATRRVEEMRADFVANASHELRTPLAAISGFIDTLQGHAKDDPDARERFLQIMNVETSRMQRLIDDLLSLARIELNEHNPPMDRVDLVGIVRNATAALAPLAEMDNITLKIGASEPLWTTGDRDELTQVFQNLIHNAIKYGRTAGVVHIEFGTSSGGQNDTRLQIFASVRDEGEGIPREAVPRLTERFYRVDIKRSRERGGTGLGLAIVKHILNRHSGKLQVESVIGEGSTFMVSLPADPSEEEGAEQPSKAEFRHAS